MNATSNNITVFQIGPGGSLVPVPGSPFSLPAGEAATGPIAYDPVGNYVYTGTENGPLNNIVKSHIDSLTGVLTTIGTFSSGLSASDMVELVSALVANPDGHYLVAVLHPYITIFSTNTMTPVPGSPVMADCSTGYASSVQPGDPVFNSAGSLLFVGDSSPDITDVSVYQFQP